ncbi:MAG: aminotransferase class I/II-fold pyridoxal phosphate-dependent enzyme [Ruminococcaceae bacterium]|nr:aminotransferase class I/II-fold pyridoxal phosphate-dependent enzyme [Oscillospiraceae bacterium]
MIWSQKTREELLACRDQAAAELEAYRAQSLKLDLTRGKPSAEQLNLSSGMLGVITHADDCFSESGLDCRNYGILDGLPETKQLFADLLGIKPERIIVAGNSSLNLMFDTVVRCMLFGVRGGYEPWGRQGRIKFLCPSPGYDRHFAICRSLGIEMIPIPMTPEGPDMKQVRMHVCSDPSVKGIWCVPKFSNPEGVTYSDAVVEELASLRPAAPDFRIFWDNAYAVHELYDEEVPLADIFALAEENGTVDNIFYFASTSKISFPGSGVAIMAASENNIHQIKPILSTQTIGFDKINQMRHVKYFGDADGIHAHMRRHAAVLRPKFDAVLDILEAELGGLGIADWTSPRGGYFISLNTMDDCARRVYRLAKSVGVALTEAGATYPYGCDPRDRNLRIAPSFPTLPEITAATKVLCTCVKLASAEKLLEE